MTWGAVGSAVAGAAASKVLGGGKSTTKTEMDPFVKQMVSNYSNAYQNSPVPQYNLDNLTAAMNPYQMDALAQAGNYAQGAGADQVAMMNAAGLGQMGVANTLAQVGEMGAMGSGTWMLNELANAMGGGPSGGGGGGSSMMGYGGGVGGGDFGGGSTTLGGDLKFKYDQDTFDQSYGNLIGSAQGAFDSYSNKTKTNNLFQNASGLKIDSQLLGGANTKVGQGASLLDAMTNQMITDYGAQMQQWASGTADANAMRAGQGNQNTALGQYSTDVQAATSRANAAMSAATSAANAKLAANTQKYNALVGAAASMYGNSGQMLSNAGTQYGNANVSFGNANDTAVGNIGTSMAAGDYISKYDQAALDKWNYANIFNTSQPGDMNLAGFQAANGISGGSSTTTDPSLLSQLGGGAGLGSMFYDLYQANKSPTAPASGGSGTGPFSGGQNFSDIRLKENIKFSKKIGKYNYYNWSWNESAKKMGVKTPTFGVLAQEVQEINPDAVSVSDSGYLVVNYSKLH